MNQEPCSWYTNTIQIDGQQTDIDPVDNEYTDVAFSGCEIDRVASGSTTSTAAFAVRQSRQRDYAPRSNRIQPATHTWTSLRWLLGKSQDAGPLLPGDEIIVRAGEGVLPVAVAIPEPFTAQADSTTDTVSGEIGGWLSRPLSIYAEWLGEVLEVNSDVSGGYEGASPISRPLVVAMSKY